MASPTATSLNNESQPTPAQGSLTSSGAGITGGYTGNSVSLKIFIAFLIGLGMYNAVELIILTFVTFNRYRGLYFWSLMIASFGVIPYELGFFIKFFQLLDPYRNEGYVAVVFLTIGWYMMITGQSVVLWSRLHLLTNSRLVLKYTLWMIIIDGILFHASTTILTFGSNSNALPSYILARFVRGYNVMEKIQMVGFFLQELVLSGIYIKETLRLLRLSQSVKEEEVVSSGGEVVSARGNRKLMYQLLTINVIIVGMDCALLGVEFANLYLIETTLKGVVYSIKLKLEFAVLGKLVQIVRTHSGSDTAENMTANGGGNGGTRRGTIPSVTVSKSRDSVTRSRDRGESSSWNNNNTGANGIVGAEAWPDFVDPRNVTGDVTHAEMPVVERVGSGEGVEREGNRRRSRAQRGSWIDVELDKHNIG